MACAAREARRRSAAMLAEVGLGDRLRSAIDVLSGGEQQRVAIARALVHEPKLLLADEPTGNLDEETAQQVLPLVMSLVRKRGATLLLVTHDRSLARAPIACSRCGMASSCALHAEP